MRDFGVLIGNEADWFWEFDGDPGTHQRLIAAINAAAEDLANEDD